MPIKLTINKARVPINCWTESLESEAIEQAVAVANFMPVFRSLGVMPDGHSGYTLPIGGVAPLINAVAPMCVGYDQGCGVFAVKTSLKFLEKDKHRAIRELTAKLIPLGKGQSRQNKVYWELFDQAPDQKIIKNFLSLARTQLGTLGGGNHFIEVQMGSDGHIWIMLHSGSRGFGWKVTDYYHKNVALTQGIVPNGIKALAYLPMDSQAGQDYWEAMQFCLKYAYQNRVVMMGLLKEAFVEILKGNIDFLEEVNIHHNYAAKETHFGQDVYVHRKGATLATKDTIGIIPGSMGTASYIVKGKGNPESYTSCSHGSGRIMSRSAAKKEMTLEKYKDELEAAGLEFDPKYVSLDEAPSAYKNSTEVMKNQEDLVEILVELRPYQFQALKGID